MLNRLICLILGYFIGAIIQTGFWIGKFNHIDIRDYGSGNAGTTNTMRTLGKKAGFITYFMDAFKSCITAIIIHFIYGSNADISEMLLILYGGFGVVLGHNFPFYLGFRGGKGIAASAGMLLAMDWRVFLICAVIFIGLVAITRYVSLGSMAAYVGALICFIGFGAAGSYGMDFPHTFEMDVIMGLMTALAIYRHRANIYRLLNGTENKLGAAKTAAK